MAKPGRKRLAKAINLSFFHGGWVTRLVLPLSIYPGGPKKSVPGQKWSENGSKMSGPGQKQPENGKTGPKDASQSHEFELFPRVGVKWVGLAS